MPAPTIIALKEIFGREFGDEVENARAVRIFRITMDQDCFFMSSVMDATGTYSVPAIGEMYNSDRMDLRCVSREINEVERSLRVFTVTLRYDRFPYYNWDVKISGQTVEAALSETLEDSGGATRPARFILTPSRYLTTKPLAAKGEVPLNRAGDRFDPPITYNRQQLVIDCSVMLDNILDMGPSFTSVGDLTSLIGKVNNDEIRIFSIPNDASTCDYWSLLLEDVNVSKIKVPVDALHPAGCAYAIALRIIYDPLGHCAVPLNSGYSELVWAGGVFKKRKCRGNDQAEVSSPALLDDVGTTIVPGAVIPATYIICPTHETFAFSSLGLPESFCDNVFPTPAP